MVHLKLEQSEGGAELEDEFEIERKFEVKSLPLDLESYPHFELVAGYFDDNGKTVRIRQEAEDGQCKYYKEIKVGSGVKRKIKGGKQEVTKEEFDRLWPKTKLRRVGKTRYVIPYEEFVIQLDVYHGDLAGCYTVEVEFDSVEEARRFTPPDWFGKERTKDKRYSSESLATLGWPEG